MGTQQEPLFALGQIVATPDALAALEASGQNAVGLLSRHQSGDWGQLCDEDRRLNDQAVRGGSRILSSYTLEPTGQKVWIITESDRSSTCLLLPENY